MTQLTSLSPPGEEPVTLATAKSYLRIGHAGEDGLVLDLLRAARTRLEQVAGLALVARTFRLSFCDWPASLSGRGARLPVSPVTELLAVRVISPEGTVTDHLDRFLLRCGRLCLRPWSMAPIIAMQGRIEIDMRAGFGPASRVPADLQEALLRLMAAMYASRPSPGAKPDAAAGLPREVRAILDARKEVRL